MMDTEDRPMTPAQIERASIEILTHKLDERGWAHEIVRKKEGYDLKVRPPHGKWRRAEVKGGTRNGWLHIDIRSASKVRWSNGNTDSEPYVRDVGRRAKVTVTFDLDRLKFDEVFVVASVGSTHPTIYRFSREHILRDSSTRLSSKKSLIFSLGNEHNRRRQEWPRH